MPMTAQQISEKWKRNYTNSAQSFTDGINGITESPMAKAILAKDRMIAKWTAAIQAGKWEAGLRAVGLAEWKAKTIRLGTARMADGAQQGADNTRKFFEFWLPVVGQLREQINNMPSATPADRKARMNAAFDFLSKQQYVRRP